MNPSSQQQELNDEYPAFGKPWPVECDKCDFMLKDPVFPKEAIPTQHYMFHVPSKWNTSKPESELHRILTEYASVNDKELGEDKFDGHYDIEKAVNAIHSHMQAGFEAAIGKPIELRADIDDELKQYVPDMEERSIEVTGVSSSFTNLYTRAIIKSTQEAQHTRATKYLKGEL